MDNILGLRPPFGDDLDTFIDDDDDDDDDYKESKYNLMINCT